MNSENVKHKIDEAIKLGEYLIFQNFSEIEFSRYQLLINEIADSLFSQKVDGIKLRVCLHIKETVTDDFILDLLGSLKYYLFSGMTGGKNYVRNSRKEIVARYILDINSRLPILC